MLLAWNEIRHRAIKSANENAKAASEAGEKQTFWNEFFQVFGIARKTVASFEAPVKKLIGHGGAIDLFCMRNALIAASGGFRWEKISPAVFGSLFQDVMLPKERRQLGAHYTAEKNIMKVVRSLFLDDCSIIQVASCNGYS
jgi:hypothetical protein